MKQSCLNIIIIEYEYLVPYNCLKKVIIIIS